MQHGGRVTPRVSIKKPASKRRGAPPAGRGRRRLKRSKKRLASAGLGVLLQGGTKV